MKKAISTIAKRQIIKIKEWEANNLIGIKQKKEHNNILKWLKM